MTQSNIGVWGFFIAVLVTAFSVSVYAREAGAVSLRVKLACASDYYAYCSMHRPDTPGVRRCRNAAGPKLSQRCVNALVSAGEVSANEVQQRRERRLAAQRRLERRTAMRD